MRIEKLLAQLATCSTQMAANDVLALAIDKLLGGKLKNLDPDDDFAGFVDGSPVLRFSISKDIGDDFQIRTEFNITNAGVGISVGTFQQPDEPTFKPEDVVCEDGRDMELAWVARPTDLCSAISRQVYNTMVSYHSELIQRMGVNADDATKVAKRNF